MAKLLECASLLALWRSTRPLPTPCSHRYRCGSQTRAPNHASVVQSRGILAGDEDPLRCRYGLNRETAEERRTQRELIHYSSASSASLRCFMALAFGCGSAALRLGPLGPKPAEAGTPNPSHGLSSFTDAPWAAHRGASTSEWHSVRHVGPKALALHRGRAPAVRHPQPTASPCVELYQGEGDRRGDSTSTRP